MTRKVFYIEDEQYMARIVKDTLERKGYEVLHRRDGSRVIEQIVQFAPDICLLDVMLPNVDGFSIGSHIRSIYPRLPIIFITAKTQTDDILRGFSSGGTDYMKKPFSMEELMVRMENQLRLVTADTPPQEALPEEIELKRFRFYPGKFELHKGDTIIRLSHRETQILSMLVTYRNKTLDRKMLLHTVWGDDSFFNSRNLDVYIRKLREYLAGEPGIEIITLKGKGYHFSVA